jgi:predicted CoA-binding protein
MFHALGRLSRTREEVHIGMHSATGNATDENDTIRRLLRETGTWAVVGLSDNQSRAAYGVAGFLQSIGKRIVPVHPKAVTVHGEQGYAALAEIPFPVDVVDVLRRSEAAGAFADQAVAIGARAVWFQLGVVDLDAYQRTRAAGLDMVMDRCPAIEWPRLERG